MSINLSVDDHVARVTIDRPERRNAVDAATADQLEETWRAIETNPDVRVVVVTGSGDRAFCAGADLKAGSDEKSGLEYWAHARPNGFGG